MIRALIFSSNWVFVALNLLLKVYHRLLIHRLLIHRLLFHRLLIQRLLIHRLGIPKLWIHYLMINEREKTGERVITDQWVWLKREPLWDLSFSNFWMKIMWRMQEKVMRAFEIKFLEIETEYLGSFAKLYAKEFHPVRWPLLKILSDGSYLVLI